MIIKPLEYVDFDKAIFLAGPILGVEDWQSYAIEYLQKRDSNISVICPRRLEFSGFNLEEQINWEQHYLQKILEDRNKGVVIFWCPKEQEHNCTNPYAKQTRIEFGEAVFGLKYFNSKVVVGIEKGFYGAEEFRLMLKDYNVDISSSLEKTCDEALLFIGL